MIRLMRNSKWEWAVYAGVSTAFMLGLVYAAWTTIRGNVPEMNWWSGWAVALWIADVAIAYLLGRRIHRRLDQLQLAMKEAATSNWSVRLPELSRDAFGETYREFNAMLDRLETRMKLLQQLGEKNVMEEAPALEVAVQEERRRLARDLHDTVSQQLFALHMAASALPKLVERNPEQGGKVMEQLIEMSSSAQKQMRGLIAQLRPMELQGKSLTEAFDRWFPDFCRQNGLQGTLDVQVNRPISEAKEHQIFLIAQEAMANVVKHSKASEVRLALGETESQIMLQIEDNGEGFKAEQIRAGSYGLTSMRERAEKLGGEAEIVTKPGTGTRVLVRFPNF
ncbi:HAMP domain-containing sensor histidine kinase [Cohnella thailandensis]|uniref:Oxygen sensor histidine kinase NreB n=1 Tax=Cohnella thailandensis TaxID=557557 RepID=A0A841SUM2_9BACL|nr:HAMP domain-containing sensor histidine kinase [Cohnella thailandensis]MBB6633745.1 HAMP domain-containing sensor histidine kinase [Cohnella thailandensis]MBP1976533.1 NarL family two-component system sensor histidine kinase LiaS [Cohnella thailandensis]